MMQRYIFHFVVVAVCSLIAGIELGITIYELRNYAEDDMHD